MNSGKQFWLDLWYEGRTSFHKDIVNADLKTYYSSLELPAAATVLVPLCGKSLDMLWLVEQGAHVIGIELSELAVLQFASENHLNMTKKACGAAINYSTGSISIWVADIFTFPAAFIDQVDAIYDRAALIALPPKLRTIYVQSCLQWLKKDGKIFLKTMSYDQMQMEGPPFSVTDSEVQMLYRGCHTPQCINETTRQINEDDPLYARGLRGSTDHIWLIQH